MSRIFFLCPAPNEPTGGVRTIYRLARQLSARGLPAAVVHAEKSVHMPWLLSEGELPERFFQRVPLHAGDVFVVPEWWAWKLQPHLRGVRKVVFNQGTYLSFLDAPSPPEWKVTPYEDDETLLTIVISEDGERYLRHAFPQATLHRIHLSVDPALYFPEAKREAIAVMPRRRRSDQAQVFGMLFNRGGLQGFARQPIDGVSPVEAARLLRTSQVYLSFAYELGEGFGLPIAEALASGCVVVGYCGQGGQELLTEETGFPIPEGDVMQFAATAETVLARARDDPEPVLARAAEGSRRVRATYTPEREQQDLVDAFAPLVDSPQGPLVTELDLGFLVKPERLAKVVRGVRALKAR